MQARMPSIHICVSHAGFCMCGRQVCRLHETMRRNLRRDLQRRGLLQERPATTLMQAARVWGSSCVSWLQHVLGLHSLSAGSRLTLSPRNLPESSASLRSTCALISSGANSLPALEEAILTLPEPSATTRYGTCLLSSPTCIPSGAASQHITVAVRHANLQVAGMASGSFS